MVCYVDFLSATSPDTMDGSPTRSIALIPHLHVAGEEGGSATMVAVFLPVLPVLVRKKLKEGPAWGLGMLPSVPPWPALRAALEVKCFWVLLWKPPYLRLSRYCETKFF
jgi:hypothetical protein